MKRSKAALLAACSSAALLFIVASQVGCTTVRQLREPSTIPTTGQSERTRTADAHDYSVAIPISAPPEVVWQVLSDAPSYTSWNSTVVKLDGSIALGSEIKLVSKEAPERTFELKVTTFDPAKKMVWEDGGSMFLGVRTFTLVPGAGGTTVFAMSETLSGGMLGMIEGSLPDFRKSFDTFAADLKKKAETKATTTASK